MESKLKKIFDYQRFERNEKLEKLISETESYYSRELSDDDLLFVNAAGEAESCIVAPPVLPAEKLAEETYNGMVNEK